MKKWLKWLVIVGVSLFIAGCSGGSNSNESSTVDYTLAGTGTDSTITFEYEDDKVLKQTAVNVVNYDEAKTTKEQLQTAMESLTSSYKDIKGLSYDVEYGDTEAKETVVVDYTKVDLKELADLQGVTFDSDADDADSVSLKKTVELLEKSGYTKVGDEESSGSN